MQGFECSLMDSRINLMPNLFSEYVKVISSSNDFDSNVLTVNRRLKKYKIEQLAKTFISKK